MAPKIRIQAKQAKKKVSKKKNKTKSRKKVAFKVPQEIQEKCKDWIIEQKRIPKSELDAVLVEKIPSDDEIKQEPEETPENPAEFEIPFRQLPKLADQIRISDKMMLECEWNGCKRDFIETQDYFRHIGEHSCEIVAEEETEGKMNLHIDEIQSINASFSQIYNHVNGVFVLTKLQT